MIMVNLMFLIFFSHIASKVVIGQKRIYPNLAIRNKEVENLGILLNIGKPLKPTP